MRRSLLEPIEEFNLAAKLLDAAADAVLNKRTGLAATLINEANFPEIMAHARLIVGKLSHEVHRKIKKPEVLPDTERDPIRMPSEKVQEAIFIADGWRCRFCGIKVISKKARNILVKAFPNETRWGAKEFSRHSSLYAMAVSLDHVVPHSRGGLNDRHNFVTACYCCQFGRGQWTLEESELIDPRNYKPVIDDWDGLSRLHGLTLVESNIS